MSCGNWNQDLSCRSFKSYKSQVEASIDLTCFSNKTHRCLIGLRSWEFEGRVKSMWADMTVQNLCHVPQTASEHFLPCHRVHYPADNGHFFPQYKPCGHLSSRQKTGMHTPRCQLQVLSTVDTHCVFWQLSIIAIITIFCSLYYNSFFFVRSLWAPWSSFTTCASIDNLW